MWYWLSDYRSIKYDLKTINDNLAHMREHVNSQIHDDALDDSHNPSGPKK